MELAAADREGRAQLLEVDALALACCCFCWPEHGLRARIGEHVVHHGIAEHGEVACPQRPALRPRRAGIEIDLERRLAALDTRIEADEAEGGASVARLGLDLARPAARHQSDRGRHLAVQIALAVERNDASVALLEGDVHVSRGRVVEADHGVDVGGKVDAERIGRLARPVVGELAGGEQRAEELLAVIARPVRPDVEHLVVANVAVISTWVTKSMEKSEK